MNIFEKLVGMGLGDDLTETAWWTETVFRELSREDLEVATEAAIPSIEPAAGSQ